MPTHLRIKSQQRLSFAELTAVFEMAALLPDFAIGIGASLRKGGLELPLSGGVPLEPPKGIEIVDWTLEGEWPANVDPAVLGTMVTSMRYSPALSPADLIIRGVFAVSHNSQKAVEIQLGLTLGERISVSVFWKADELLLVCDFLKQCMGSSVDDVIRDKDQIVVVVKGERIESTGGVALGGWSLWLPDTLIEGGDIEGKIKSIASGASPLKAWRITIMFASRRNEMSPERFRCAWKELRSAVSSGVGGSMQVDFDAAEINALEWVHMSITGKKTFTVDLGQFDWSDSGRAPLSALVTRHGFQMELSVPIEDSHTLHLTQRTLGVLFDS